MSTHQDKLGHSSIQPWSAGEIFPAVIVRVERYPAGETAATTENFSTSWELRVGAYREEYATYEDAREVARFSCQNGRINPARYAELMRVDRRINEKPGVLVSIMRAAFGLPKIPDRYASSRAVDLVGVVKGKP